MNNNLYITLTLNITQTLKITWIPTDTLYKLIQRVNSFGEMKASVTFL